MKKIIIAAALMGVCAAASAQNTQDAVAAAAAAVAQTPAMEAPAPKPNYWTESIKTNINFGQTSLTNWAAGGDNTNSLKAYVDANANYKNGDVYWNNRLQLDYGFVYVESKPIVQKSDDRIYLESKYGKKVNQKLSISANYNFKSQFTDGFNYKTPALAQITAQKPDATSLEELSKSQQKAAWKDARVGKSGFLSPAYTNIALGIDYIPTNWLTVNIAPLTGGFVIVQDALYRSSYGMELGCAEDDAEYLAAKAAYEADKNSTALQAALGDFYKSARFEFGAQIKMDAKFKVNDNLTGSTQLLLFSNYLDHPQNMRVNWDCRFDWKLAKYFTLTLTSNLIYDDKVMIYSEEDDLTKQRIQFKESLQFGFTYTIASKK